jgi:hypothetical protein
MDEEEHIAIQEMLQSSYQDIAKGIINQLIPEEQLQKELQDMNNFTSSTTSPYGSNIFYTSYGNSKYNNYDYFNNFGWEPIVETPMSSKEYKKAFNEGREFAKGEGLEEGFNICKRLILPYPDGLKQDTIEEIFGTSNIIEILKTYSGGEIKTLIDDYLMDNAEALGEKRYRDVYV